jgi:methyltransferase
MPEGLFLLALIAAQRLGELILSRRNTALLMAKGGVEFGASHYLLMVGFHTAWLLGMVAFGWDHHVSRLWLAVIVAMQVARFSVVRSLGQRWTTRIIVLPGVPPVKTGLYSLMRHPNYVVVAVEIAAVPLALGLREYALVFFVLHLLVLGIRIKAEDKALAWAANPNLAKP